MSAISNGEPLHLLRTKLYRPRPAGDLVHRRRLSEILDGYRDRTVTLICAPAGFGKTTLLTDWLEHCECPSAWLSLDKSDGELGVFLAYFVAAVRTLFPFACAETLALLDEPVLPPLRALVTCLANDLDSLADDSAGRAEAAAGAPRLSLPAGRRFTLVLDDYHLVRDPAVDSLLGELLRYPPRTLRLIISARQDPPFLNYSLRARGDFSEIRIGELRFTPDEVAAFMRQTLTSPLDDEALATLAECTEGWGTGLRLTALTLKAGGDPLAPEMIENNRYTSDYLIAEVLSHLPIATQDFLLQTSILDRLTGPLCDAVISPVGSDWDGRAYLQWLTVENVFTFSLDAEGKWYRYHHLFQKLLRSQLERRYCKEDIAELHGRAAAWFEQNGDLQQAIEHSLAAGNELAVAQLIEKHRHDLMNRFKWRQLEQWLGLLPRQLIDARPELLTLEAWLAQNQWRYAELLAYLDRIEAMMEQGAADGPVHARLRAEVDTLRSVACYYLLDWQRSFECAERALRTLPAEYATARGTAWMYFANGRFMAGDFNGALEAIHDALNEDSTSADAFATRLYVGLCLLHWVNADPRAAMLPATKLMQLAQERKISDATSWAHYFRGCALYDQNDLAGAEAEFASAFNQRYMAHDAPFSQSAFALALTLCARGEFDRAREILDSVATYAFETNSSRIRADAEAFRAYLAGRAGAEAEALRWANAFDPHTPQVPLATVAVPRLLRAQILVTSGSAAGRAEAGRELNRLRELAEKTYNVRYQIQIHALQALLHDAEGNRTAALAALEQAVTLAEPGGITRPLVDLGPKLAGLLRQLTACGKSNAYRMRLLSAFGESGPSAHAPGVPGAGRAGLALTLSGGDGLVEPLSRRELDVLLLLNERMTDKEIAQELVISPQTVKRHASNIYQKLAVNSRRDAVAKAAAFGLLQESATVRRRSQPSY